MTPWRDPRTGLAVYRPLTRRTALKVRSKRLAARERIYSKRRAAFLEARPWCAVGGCEATEVHHMAGRGAALLDESRWLPVCHDHHVYVTEHATEALVAAESRCGVSPIRPENRIRYPADWRTISDGVRFTRAESVCECEGECGNPHALPGRCTARHGSPHPVTRSGVVLTVAHLDHTPENCDLANLKAMCQRCHLSYDGKHHAANAARTRALRETSGMDSMFGDGAA